MSKTPVKGQYLPTMWKLLNDSSNYSNVNSTNWNTTSDYSMNTTKYTVVPAQTLSGVLTMVANLVLLIVLLRFKSAHFNLTTRYFMVLEALAHMHGGLTAIVRPHVPDSGCVIFGLSALFSGAMVISGMFLLAVDSFIAVAYPYTFRTILTPLRGMIAIAIVTMFWIGVAVAMLLTGEYVAPPYLKLCTVNDGKLHPVGLIAFCGSLLVLLVATIVVQVRTMLILHKIARKVSVLQNPSSVASAIASSTPAVNDTESEQLTKANALPLVNLKNKNCREYLTLEATVQENDENPSKMKREVTPAWPAQPSCSTSVEQVEASIVLPQVDGEMGSTLPSKTTSMTDGTPEQSSNGTPIVLDVLQLSVPDGKTTTKTQSAGKRKPTRQERLMCILSASILLTLLCWPQVLINTMIASFCDIYKVDRTRFDAVRVPLVALVIVNSFVYPILVLAMSSELMAAAQKLFCGCWPFNR